MSMTEAMFDTEQMHEAKDQENAELIVKLLLYSRSLEEQVIALRREVNRLTPQGQSKPYEDLHSDLYENFDDYPAFERYREIIDLFLLMD